MEKNEDQDKTTYEVTKRKLEENKNTSQKNSLFSSLNNNFSLPNDKTVSIIF